MTTEEVKFACDMAENAFFIVFVAVSFVRRSVTFTKETKEFYDLYKDTKETLHEVKEKASQTEK